MQIIDVMRLGSAKRLERYAQVVPTIVIEHPTVFRFQQDTVEELLDKIWGIGMTSPVHDLEDMSEEDFEDEDHEKEIGQYLELYRELRRWLRTHALS